MAQKFSSIAQQIDVGRSLQLTDTAMRFKALIKVADEKYLMMNIKTILTKYKKILEPSIMTYKITGVDALRYEYRPTILSYDVYGTIEMAPLILYINGMWSASQFYNLDRGIKLFTTNIDDTLNEIILMEEMELNRNDKEVKADLANL